MKKSIVVFIIVILLPAYPLFGMLVPSQSKQVECDKAHAVGFFVGPWVIHLTNATFMIAGLALLLNDSRKDDAGGLIIFGIGAYMAIFYSQWLKSQKDSNMPLDIPL